MDNEMGPSSHTNRPVKQKLQDTDVKFSVIWKDGREEEIGAPSYSDVLLWLRENLSQLSPRLTSVRPIVSWKGGCSVGNYIHIDHTKKTVIEDTRRHGVL